MRCCIATPLAVAIIAPAAGADWLFELSSDTLSPQNPSTWVWLEAAFDPADYAFAGASLQVHASEVGWSDPRIMLRWDPGPAPGGGTVAGASVIDISQGQLHFPPVFVADPSNPIVFWGARFTVTDFTLRDIALSTTTDQFRVYIDPMSTTSEPRPTAEGAAVIRVIPAPPAAALLALGALCRVRRHRAGVTP